MTKDNHEVRTVKVADKTGAVNLSLWDEPGKLIQSGDIIRMTKGYTSVWKGCLTLYAGKQGEFHKVGDFCLIFSETPFLSEYSAELDAMKAASLGDRGSQPGKGGFGGGGGPNRNNGTGGGPSQGPPGGGSDGGGPGGGGSQAQQRRYQVNGGPQGASSGGPMPAWGAVGNDRRNLPSSGSAGASRAGKDKMR